MENARPGFFEVKILPFPKRIRAARMEKCPVVMILFSHDVGVRSRRLGSRGDLVGVDIVRTAGLENLLSEGILADKVRAKKRKRRARLGQINQNVVRSAAGTL